MAYLDYPGLAYFKSLLDQTYLRVDYDGDTTIAGNVTFTNPITGDVDGRAKKDWLGQQFDTTYLKDIQPDESGALKLILGNGQVSHLVTDTTVTQERSSANETYPILLCYDENATADQIAKKVKYGHDVQINPAYGYIYAQGYVEKHPAYNRTTAQSSRVEWMLDFRDSVLNPVGQIYSYIDPSSQGGEHRMEFRLYGNPHTTNLNLPNYNFETDTVSLGVSSTKGDKLTFFGYAPSTPIYLEDGSTMRKSTVRGDQYGRDIITRDWLNLNGSITGLVHTYMDETIDGYKTFLKTVTVDSGNDNAKAGLNVQGDVNIDSGDASKPSNFYVQGNSHIHGNEDIDGNLNVDGTSDQHGNVHMYSNLDVDGNANTDGNQTVGGTLTVTGKITGNGGAEISGGNGLKVNGTTTTTNLSVTDDATIGDDLTVNGDESVAGNLGVGGTINKISGNTTQEYVTYVTNQTDTRKNIAQNLVDTSKGLGYDSSTGKIYVKASTSDGLKFNSNGTLAVDFSQMPTDKFEALLKGLKMQVPLSSNISFYVDINSDGDSLVDGRGTEAKPFKHIQNCINYVTQIYAFGIHSCTIYVKAGIYEESITLPEFTRSSGYILLKAYSENKDAVIFSRNGDTTLACTGGKWYVRFMHLKHESIATVPATGKVESCAVANNGSTLRLAGNKYETVFHSNFDNSAERYHEIRMVSSDDNSSVHLDVTSASSEFISRTQTNTRTFVLMAMRSGNLLIHSYSGTSASMITDYPCSGGATIFAECSSRGSIAPVDSGRDPVFTVSGIFSGKRYRCTTGGTIQVHGNSDGEYFPGTDDGTVDSNTYCWYND